MIKKLLVLKSILECCDFPLSKSSSILTAHLSHCYINPVELNALIMHVLRSGPYISMALLSANDDCYFSLVPFGQWTVVEIAIHPTDNSVTDRNVNGLRRKLAVGLSRALRSRFRGSLC